MLVKSEYLSPIGKLTLVASDNTLVGLWIAGQRHHVDVTGIPFGHSTVLQRASRWLDIYFAGGHPAVDFELSPTGTAFQRVVWRALREIPYGTVASYADIARHVGCASARAVGGAVGRNPISIIIPCHRVVGAHGAMIGYAGGIDAKKKLLGLEQGIIPAK